jgi:hypothetical protein
MNEHPQYECRECGITNSIPGIEINGEVLAWADDDLCCFCQDRLHAALIRDAARYRNLRNRQGQSNDIGVAAFLHAPDNAILDGEDLDRAIDQRLGFDSPEVEPLEKRLADCLAAIIDTPLFSGHDETGRPSSALDIRLGFFRPELSERAAELLEEAGQ